MNINKTSDTNTREIYTIHLEGNHGEYQSPFTWIDYINDSGKVIDSEVMDYRGNFVDDTALYKQLEQAVDGFEKK
jgi:hypothetical protein